MKSIHLKLSDDELDSVDRWKEAVGIRTRSEAIRQMIRHAVVNLEGGGDLKIAQGFSDRKNAKFVTQPILDPADSDGDGVSDIVAALVRKEVQQAIKELLEKS